MLPTCNPFSLFALQYLEGYSVSLNIRAQVDKKPFKWLFSNFDNISYGNKGEFSMTMLPDYDYAKFFYPSLFPCEH